MHGTNRPGSAKPGLFKNVCLTGRRLPADAPDLAARQLHEEAVAVEVHPRRVALTGLRDVASERALLSAAHDVHEPVLFLLPAELLVVPPLRVADQHELL